MVTQKQMITSIKESSLAEALSEAVERQIAAEVKRLTKEMKVKGSFPYEDEDFADVEESIIDSVVEVVDLIDFNEALQEVLVGLLQELVGEVVSGMESDYDNARERAFPAED